MRLSKFRLVLIGLVLALFGASGASALTSVQSKYLSQAQHGVKLAGRYWGNARFHWYNVLLKDPKPYPQAAIWDAVPLFESLDEIAIASPTAANKQAVVNFANHAEIYWDPALKPGPGYVPYPGGRGVHTQTFFDDNSVWGLAFMDAYKATGSKRYVSDAERAMNFVIRYAWDAAAGGGVWWNTWHVACQGTRNCTSKTVRHSEVLAMATDLASELYQATGIPQYLQTAEKYFYFEQHKLLKWDGSYAEQVAGEQTMPHDGEGALVSAFVALCDAKVVVPANDYNFLPWNSVHHNPSQRRPTDPTSFCSWAQSLAHKTAFGVKIGPTVYDRYLPLNAGPTFDDYYVRGLLTLYGNDPSQTFAYQVAAQTAARILKHSVNSQGLYLKAWNGSTRVPGDSPGMLRTHAASVSVLATLAANAPPNP